jgi:hypothetical protein
MSQPTATSNQPDVLTAAKAVVEALSKLDKRGQGQAIRFASEVLDLEAVRESRRPLVEPEPIIEGAAVSEPLSRTKDIKSFVDEKSPKSDGQFAAVIAYYFRFEAPREERKDTISAADLTEAARLSRRPIPPVPSATLNNAKNAGYLDSSEKGRFKLNAVGENLVAITLPGEGTESNGIRKTSRRGKSAKPSAKRPVKKSLRKSAKTRK